MLSVIVVAHGRPELASTCLGALARSSIADALEVILVDNGSPTPLHAVVDELRPALPGLRYLRNERNLTFSIANNLAAAEASGRYLLFLNNDVVADSATPAALSAALEGVSSADIAGGLLLYPGRERIQHAGIHRMLWGYVSNHGVGASADDQRFRKPGCVFAVTGAMLCIRREVFAALGGFDPGYRWGYEDVDLCLKARARGHEVLYLPDATAVHAESATLRSARSQADLAANYSLYRTRWDSHLVPGESVAISRLKSSGARRVVVFGAGTAAEGLFRALTAEHVDVLAFATSAPPPPGQVHCGRPVVALASVASRGHDRVVVGSQSYWEVEDEVDRADPTGAAWFPLAAE